MKRVMLILVAVVTISGCLALSGCTETQKQFGQGDPPVEYMERFGNTNADRLNFLQQKQLDEHTTVINKQAQALANLTEQVMKLEDPNSMLDLTARIEALEKKPEVTKINLSETSEVKPLTHLLMKKGKPEFQGKAVKSLQNAFHSLEGWKDIFRIDLKSIETRLGALEAIRYHQHLVDITTEACND